MFNLIKEFLLVFIAIFSVNMIYFYFRNKNKKYRKIPTVEMELLVRAFDVDISMIDMSIIKKHISIINSVIISVDLLILYHIKSIIIAMLIIIVLTFALIALLYGILGSYYKNLIYRR